VPSKSDSPSLSAITNAQLVNMLATRTTSKKVSVSIRLDADVLDWLKSKGPGHLTRINHILANLMEAERRAHL
jgi:uncharacterized protein (DUF4415 family)